MGWNDEEQNTKKGMNLSSKILLALIACIILIIVIVVILLMNMKASTYSISVDGATVNTVTKEDLLTKIDNKTYINIQEFAKLVEYEYHEGEYKAFTIEKDKCYVQGVAETVSFYLNDNKVYKLPINKLEENYQMHEIENTIKSVEGKMYAPIEAINLAFNVVLSEKSNNFQIYTLDYLVTTYDTRVKKWGYTGIAEQSFENQKSLLYGYLIVKKEGGLYKIIDVDNTEEIVPDKYTTIEFSENIKGFIVTNSSKQVGIINLDGTTKIEPIYEAISLLDKEADLYLIKLDQKYGVVKSGNVNVIFPEYDSIGVNSSITTNVSDNKYLLLDTLIPVCKDAKWGAYDKEGKMILEIEYEDFGYSLNNVEIGGIKKVVQPVLTIERCNGVVVKKSGKYGLMSLQGKELVPVAVESIYAIYQEENEDLRYFMVYNGEELNVIERLIKAGLIEESTKEEENVDTVTNTIENSAINNTVMNNSNNN